ncbi:MAG: IPT/TIG domain-containing protein [Actinobacteria bacterium]|nr:IPT/TIG domain-containing protein [Actinomycetota bacterium]
MWSSSRKKGFVSLLAVLLAAVFALAYPLGGLSAVAEGVGNGQFYQPYPPASDGSWPVIRHDPYNSDFSQNHMDPQLNYATSMDPAWEAIDAADYPPIKGETPAQDSGGLNDVTHFAGSVLDQTVTWRRLDSDDQEVLTGNGLLVTTVSKGYPDGVAEGTTGYCPHVIAYGTDGTLVWTSDEWANDDQNWVDQPGDGFDDFNPTVTPLSQKVPSSSLVSSSVVLDNQHRVFVADEKYMWAADAATGKLIWKWRMPSDDPYDPVSGEGTGLSSPFVTAVFMASGEVGGVHLSGRVTVFPKIESSVHGVVEGQYGDTYLPEAYKTLPEIYPEPEPGGEEPPVDMTEVLWYPGKVNNIPVDNDDNPERWMMDPELVEKALTGFAGSGAPAANTAAACPDPSNGPLNPVVTTRIFAPIIIDSFTGEDADTKLMRVDYRVGGPAGPTLYEPWGSSDEDPQGFMPGANGSASSPDVSESGKGVFLVDQNGEDSLLYGFSADTGDLLWDPVTVGTMFGSTMTTWDGDNLPVAPNGIDMDDLVYVQAEGKLIEVRQYNGQGGDLEHPAVDFNMTAGNTDPRIDDLYRIDTNGDGLEDTVMSWVNMRLPRAMISGVPVGTIPTNVAPGSRDIELTFPLAVGYQIFDSWLIPQLQRRETLWPVKVMLVVARRHQAPDGTVTWDFKRLADLKDTCETSSFPDASGNVWVSHIGTQSSFANGMKDKYPDILETLGWSELVENEDLWPVEPSGGISKIDVIGTAPSLTAIDPPSGKKGYPVKVTVTGTEFAANATVELRKGTTVLQPVNIKATSRGEIVCKFNLLGAPLGKYSVKVTNPDGRSATLTDAFTVRL